MNRLWFKNEDTIFYIRWLCCKRLDSLRSECCSEEEKYYFQISGVVPGDTKCLI